MNVLTILRSVEELLYEVMAWLLFYPLTLWKTLRRPLQTMAYSDREQKDKPDKQYLETLSPPLFLVLSILLAHGAAFAFGLEVSSARSEIAQYVVQNDQALLAFRALIFGLPGLVFAWLVLRLTGKRIDRESLRTPFFAQCYLSGATAILVSLGFLGIRHPSEAATLAGTAVIVGTTVWYLGVQWAWLRRETTLRPVPALGLTIVAFAGSMGLAGAAGALLS